MPLDLRHVRIAPSVRLAVAIVAIDLALLVGLAMLIDAGILRPLDHAVIGAVRDPAIRAPLSWLAVATQLGSTWWVAGVAVVVAIVESVAGRAPLGIAAALTIGASSLANSSVKLIVGRARPDELPPLIVEPGYSFPSGHSLSAMVAYGIIAILVARSTWPPGVRAAAIIVLGAIVATVGLSRVYLGAHYPSDVVGGWLLGFAGVVIFATLSTILDPRVPTRVGDAKVGQRGEGAS